MNILYIIDSLGGGGKERRLIQLINGLIKHEGFNISIVLFEDRIDYKEILQTNVTIYKLKRRIKHDPLIFYELFKIIYKEKPDIIQSWSLMGTFYSSVIARLYGCRFIVSYVADCNKPKLFSLHGIANVLGKYLAEVVIGNTKAGLKAYGIPLTKQCVIYNGFDNERIPKQLNNGDILLQLNIPDTAKYIVAMIARFDETKDYKTYIDAAVEISEEHLDIYFLCIGQGPLLSHFKEYVKPVCKNILFTGFINKIEEVLSIVNLSVLCTNTKIHYEGISNSILEAMAMGIPVIATKGGGTNELILDGECGYLIELNDKVTLKERIIALIEDNEKVVSFGQKCKQIVKEKFLLEKMTDEYIKLYIR